MYALSDDIGEKTDLLARKQPPTGSVRAIALNLRDDLVGWLARMHPSYPTELAAAGGRVVPPPFPLDEAHYGIPDYVGHAIGDTGD